MNEKIRELLYRSLDESLSGRESEMLGSALAASSTLRDELESAIRIRVAMSAGPAETFEPYFVQRVMSRITEARSLESVGEMVITAMTRLFRPLAAALAVTVIALAGWNVVATGEVAPQEEAASVEADAGMLATPLDALLEDRI